MSYMRGPCYIWRDDTRVHVWAEDGYDGWDDTNWAERRTHAEVLTPAPRNGASGVGIRQEIADAYVQGETMSSTLRNPRRQAFTRMVVSADLD